MNEKELQYLAAIVRDSDDAIIGKTMDGIITSWNNGAEHIYGYTAEEAIGRTVAMLVPPDREDELPKIFEKLSRGERIKNYKTLQVAKDGRLLNVSLTISTVRDASGAIIGASSIGRDVTAEREAQDALRESAKAYKLLMEQASDAILVSYPDQSLIEVNQRASDMLGYTKEELLNLRAEASNPGPPALSALPLRLDEILKGDVVYAERPMVRKDGTLLVTELSTRRLDDGRIVTIARDITERKRAEQVLKESEQRLQSIVDNTLAVIFMKDLEGRYILVNRMFERSLGMSNEEIIGKTDYDLQPREIAGALRANDVEVMDAKSAFEFEEVVLQPDGQHTYLTNKFLMYNSEGEHYALCGVSTDITERRRLEAEMGKSEMQLAEAQKIAHIGSWEANVATGEATWSDELYRIFGVKPQSHPSTFERFLEYIHPDDRAFVRRQIERAYKKGGSFAYEYRAIRLDGSIRTLHTRGRVIMSEDGAPARVIGTAQDITENKQAEDDLRERTELLSEAQRLGRLGSWEWDVLANKVVWSDELFRLYGLEPQQFGGTYEAYLEYVHPDDRERVSNDIERALVEKDSFAHEFRFVRPDGTVLHGQARGETLLDEAGNVVTMRGTARDITESKEAEEALRKSEELYRMMFAGSPIPMWVYATGTLEFLEVNDAAVAHYGYTRKEFLSMRITDIRPESDIPELLEQLAKTYPNPTTSRAARHRLKSGEVIEVEIASHVLTFGGREAELVAARDVTERKRAEQERLESERRYKQMFEGNTSIQWLLDPITHTIVEANQAASDFYGYTSEELRGMNVSVINTFLGERITEVLEQMAREPVTIAARHTLASGEIRDVEGRTGPIDIGGRRLIHAIITDVTERKMAEESLRTEKEFQRAVLENIEDGIVACDAEGVLTLFNKATREFHGLPAEAVAAGQWAEHYDLYTADGQTPMTKDDVPLFQALQGQVVRNMEMVIAPKQGKSRIVSASGQAIFDSAGKKLGAVVSMHDLTERRQAEAAQRKSDELYRALARNLPNGAVFMFDSELRFQLTEGIALEMQGYSRHELEGKTIWEVLQPEACDLLVPHYRSALAGQETTLEHESNGRLYLTQFLPVKNERGETFAGMAVALDITEQKRVEGARLAQDTAEQANRAKSEFLSRMSHELRTPLNAILGFGQLLEMDVMTPDQQESVDYILKAGQHLLNLINEVLDISRIEEGKLQISLEPVFAREVVQESVDLMQPLAANRNIELKADLKWMDSCFVMADSQRLQQIMLNFLANAIKYNHDGGKVSVWCEEQESSLEGSDPKLASGKMLVISVTDTGAGLSPHQLERLFTPFERVGAEQSGVEGTGLGLALSRRLAEAMGGVIGVESEPGRGSTFHVALPSAEGQMARAKRKGTHPMNHVQGKTHTSTVLYIEDNLSNLRLIERMLKNRPQIKLITAMQGQMGLDMAFQHRPDLVLLDLHLPDMMGDEVLVRLQDDKRTASIPVVVLSADANPRQIDSLLEAGAKSYLTKPLDMKRLFEILEETLERRAP